MKHTDGDKQRQTPQPPRVTAAWPAPTGMLPLWFGLPRGLHALALAEIRERAAAAGVPTPRNWQAEGDDGVALSWPAERLASLACSLQTVEQLLVRVGAARVTDAADVSVMLGSLRRTGWLPESGIAVKVHARQGAADRARWLQGECDRQLGAVGEHWPVVVHLRAGRGDVEVAVDVVGESLHRRGYRQEAGEAPIRETYAAALLRWAGYAAGMPLWDPACGSGTLLIEAALYGQPVRLSPLSCSRWPGLTPQLASTAAAGQPASVAWIEGGDIDAATVATARRNVIRAGQHAAIAIETREMAQWRTPPASGPGLVVSNLPWGLRLSHRAEARRLAERWAAVAKRRVPGWRAAAVVPEPQWADKLGLVATEVFEVRQGGRTVWWVRGSLAGR